MTAAYDWDLDDSPVRLFARRHRRNMWRMLAFTAWTLCVYFYAHPRPTAVVCVAERAQPSTLAQASATAGESVDRATLEALSESTVGFWRGDIR